jgi:hypothetical protein
MGTRGLVVVKLKNKATAYYNQFDSYPEVLGKELEHVISHNRMGYTKQMQAQQIAYFIQGRSGHNVGMSPWKVSLPITKPNHPKIDYLFHEYVYLVDLDRKILYAYKSKWAGETKPTGSIKQQVQQIQKNVGMTGGRLELIYKKSFDVLI